MSETPDQARTRRRWVSLAELVAVAGVIIGALTLWNSWSERRADQASKAAEQSAAARAEARVDLTATPRRDGRELLIKDERHELQDVGIVFPSALGVAAQHPVAEAVIDASGDLGKTMLKLTDGGTDDRAGRLPALITVSYVDGDATRTTTGLYDVIWHTGGRLIGGRTFRLDGLRLRQRAGTPAALAAAWKRDKP
jgi:hypothetical protein